MGKIITSFVLHFLVFLAMASTSIKAQNWGAMGRGYTYFLPNSSDRFRTKLPCMENNFCWIGIKGKKGELNPHRYIKNITVSTKDDGGIDRMKTFQFLEEIETVYPDASHGECPKHLSYLLLRRTVVLDKNQNRNHPSYVPQLMYVFMTYLKTMKLLP
ncbi:hypothetical protein MKX01_008665 [Papaver californicum]|nr:hypothetical protein MKX01_008665 [Papaver californicum]